MSSRISSTCYCRNRHLVRACRIDLTHSRQVHPVTAADRTRRWEIRKKAGCGVLHIEVPIGPLADQLVEDHFLKEWDTENRAEIERALARMLIRFYIVIDASADPTDR